MNALLSAGRYLFFLPFLGFGINHLRMADGMAGMVPIPGGSIWVYITGICMIAAVVSGLMRKYDKLAFTLLGVLCLIYALAIHLPALMGGDQMAIVNLLKDLGLAGASWMYAARFSDDKSIVGA